VTSVDVEVLGIALGCAGTVAVLGLVGVRLAGRRSVRAALISVAVVSVLSVVTGVVGTARAMFISAHDLGVVLPVSAVAGAVGLAAALSLSAAVVRDVERVRSAARVLGESVGEATVAAGGSAGIRELAEIDGSGRWSRRGASWWPG
jgi:hypothetical protein